jgi:cysteine desulfurase
MALAKAAELCEPGDSVVRDHFEELLREHVSDIAINAVRAPRLPNTSNVLFRGVSAEALVIALDMRGMAVSTGSACSSGAVEPSHVLLAMGLSVSEAKSCVRFSFGRGNTLEDVQKLVSALAEIVAKMRKPVLIA